MSHFKAVKLTRPKCTKFYSRRLFDRPFVSPSLRWRL